MPDHSPPPPPLAQSASALGSRKIIYDSLFSMLQLAALIEWETEIRQVGDTCFNNFVLATFAMYLHILMTKGWLFKPFN